MTSESELLQEVRDSQVRMEKDLGFVVRQYEGHHRTLYGEDGTTGIVARQKRIETTLATLGWVLGLAVPIVTAVVVVSLQRLA